MNMQIEQVCKDCRYCKLTVVKNRVSFRCLEYSAPCYDEENYCPRYQDAIHPLEHRIKAYAWDLTHVVTLGDLVKD